MQSRTDDISPDTAEAVDTYFDWHIIFILPGDSSAPESLD
jgi:hypothetical protein